jgi:hypothetical protein
MILYESSAYLIISPNSRMNSVPKTNKFDTVSFRFTDRALSFIDATFDALNSSTNTKDKTSMIAGQLLNATAANSYDF